jgi:putative membrane protein
MGEQTTEGISERELDPRIDLAVRRTELAEQRTLLAWLRTAIALMGAGVAFDKGAQLFHQSRLETGTAIVRNGHLVGLSLTITSTLLLVVVLWQYLKALSNLAKTAGRSGPQFPPTVVATVLVILLGIAVVVVFLGT